MQVAKYTTMERPADEVEMKIVTIKDSDSLWERHGYMHTYLAGNVNDFASQHTVRIPFLTD